MSEFRSQLEDLISIEELLFDSTPGFGSVYSRFLSHSIAHPAKMNTKLTEFLIEKFTREGDIVLDPMAGSGQTGVISALRGRDAVCVELEEKFFGWMEKARKNVERQRTLAVRGRIRNVLGDARKLSQLLKEIDVIVTSPPYSECPGSVYSGLGKKLEKLCEEGKITKEQLNHFKGRKAFFEDGAESYPSSEGQIAKLSHGSVDAVITSPPYAESVTGKDGIDWTKCKRKNGKPRDRSMEPAFNNLFLGAGFRYSESEENIGNLPFADAVITSPPYSEGLGHGRGKSKQLQIEKKLYLQGAGSYSKNSENIGEIRTHETYLEAMLKVYSEMFKVLKPDGKAIIIIKPFIRNKKVVDLPYHTWLLLKKVGFQLSKLFKLRLKTQSFWRILYNKKYPDVPQIQHEYIIVCQKNVL